MGNLSRQLEHLNAERGHIMLNVDSISTTEHDIQGMLGINTVKLGASIPHHPEGARMNKRYKDQGISRFYDIRLSYRAQQMGSAITGFEEYKYDRISVNGTGVDERALVAAGCAAHSSLIVVSLATEDEVGMQKQFDRIAVANEELDDDKKICWVICESPIVAQVREALPEFVITATGIYLPGTNPDDIEHRRTPGEVRAAGADEVGIGNAIAFARDMSPAQAVELAVASWDQGL